MSSTPACTKRALYGGGPCGGHLILYVGLMITVTALGLVDGDPAVSRSGAKAGELVVMTGDLGGACSTQVLNARLFSSLPLTQPDLSGHEGILERQLKPEARTDVIRELAELGLKPTSMIDISDGLASEVFHLCASSGLGVKLYEEKLPIDPHTYKTARDFNLDPTLCVLSGGEDYELLFTISQDDYDKVRNHPKLSVIGHMLEDTEEKTLVTGLETPLKAQVGTASRSQTKARIRKQCVVLQAYTASVIGRDSLRPVAPWAGW